VQVNASSCFLCNRSATSCGTCVNFRRSLVGGLGYCAVDARREPLTGEERRPCWTGQAETPADATLLDGGLLFVEPPREARIERAPLEVRPPPGPAPLRGLLEVKPQPRPEQRAEQPAAPPPISGR
jgi:hypothetical protein